MSDGYSSEARTADLISVLSGMQKDDFDQAVTVANLRGIYFDKDATDNATATSLCYRHRYSDISRHIFTTCKKEDTFDISAFELVIEHLEEILDDLFKANPSDPLIRPLAKLRDHTSLEILRIAQQEDLYIRLKNLQSMEQRITDLTNEVNQAYSQVDEMMQSLEDQEERVESMVETINQSNAQSVTVLSIFAGMAFIFTGGFTALSGSLSILSTMTVNRSFLLMAVLILLGTVLIDAVWLLLRATRKYVGGETKMPKGFYCFNSIAAILIITFFCLFVFKSVPSENLLLKKG